MWRFVKILFCSMIAVVPLYIAWGVFSVSQKKPLPSWARNWFLELFDAPEIIDRITWILMSLFFVGLAILIVLMGVLL
jgi:hypothetical protein